MNRRTGLNAVLKGLTSRNRSHLETAFSLIELLVVVGVIAILLSLILPVTSRVQSKARQARCMHNEHQLGLGLAQFLADYNVYPLFMNKAFLRGGYPEHHLNWFQALEYEGLRASKNGPFYENEFYEAGVWRCPSVSRPSDMPAQEKYGSYGYNAYGMAMMSYYRTIGGASEEPLDLLGLGGHTTTRPEISSPPIKETEVVQPGRMLAIGESFRGSMDFGPQYGRLTDAKHQGKVNVLFCDGHLESPSVNVLFVDTNDTALSRWNRDNQPHREGLVP